MPIVGSKRMKTHSNSNSTTMRKSRKAARHLTDALLSDSREAADSIYQRARHGIQTIGESGMGMVRHNPFKTALSALAAGFALGFLMRK